MQVDTFFFVSVDDRTRVVLHKWKHGVPDKSCRDEKIRRNKKFRVVAQFFEWMNAQEHMVAGQEVFLIFLICPEVKGSCNT